MDYSVLGCDGSGVIPSLGVMGVGSDTVQSRDHLCVCVGGERGCNEAVGGS